jgi:GT2 family glycosyltransferase
VDYTIIIPVFNKAELTRNCLAKLPPSLAGAGEGEVIVIDNASTDHTPEMLAEFPWIRMIRNERNLGFSGANNQGAREARGRFLVLLNNDTEPITQWLAPMLRLAADPSVGVVGARLLYPNRTLQHAGVLVRSSLAGASSFIPYHYLHEKRADEPEASRRRDFQIVTGACLVTPRELYLELGGLDEGYWNGYEDVDYCLSVRERGLRVVYEPDATLFHFESQSGAQRFRAVHANTQRLAERWRRRVEEDSPRANVEAGVLLGYTRASQGALGTYQRAVPPTDVLVHGPLAPEQRARFEAMLSAGRSPIGKIVWTDSNGAIEAATAMMTLRGERHVAFVRSDTTLQPGWLDELLARVISRSNTCAATFSTPPEHAPHRSLLTSDARCVLLRLRQFPQHMTLAPMESLDAAVHEFLLRALRELQRTTIGVRSFGELGPASSAEISDERAIEDVIRERVRAPRGLVSIVTLSWNAHEFTIKALESIRANTSEPYEVILVDNGSGPETLRALATIDDPHVRIIYNKSNRGFAGGNNDGIAHARGDYVVMLNNDVIVTPGWVDDLLDAFRRIPGLGISAPRSNNVAGDQKLADANYRTEEEMFAFAAARRKAYGSRGYLTDRAIGFCWCIDRKVLEEVGGLDEQYGVGNFEDDDYCMRVRSAGYSIYVCDDVFIHHFGSRSFAANKVDYAASMNENWAIFARKWGFSGALGSQGYQSSDAHAKGFDRKLHYVPFPKRLASIEKNASHEPPPLREDSAIFGASVRSEDDWSEVARFVRRFSLAFGHEDPVRLVIGAFGEPHAQTIAGRVERILGKAGVALETCADIEIVDYESEDEWSAQARVAGWKEIGAIEDRSPSALRRELEHMR